MKTTSTIARYLAGVIFLGFGLNGFLHFIPRPLPSGVAGQFTGALYVSHYLWVIFGFQVIAPQGLHDAGRLKWDSGPRGGVPTYTGEDVIIVRDEKIAALYVFLDSPPA